MPSGRSRADAQHQARDARRSSFAGARLRAAPAPPLARPAARCAAAQPTASAKNVLLLGGTRFIGVYLARQLLEAGHELTLFTRGKTAIASQIPDDTPASFAAFKASIRHVAGDRSDGPGMAAALAGRSFDAVFDLNGREAADTATALAALGGASAVGQYVYCSSAGVYLKSDLMPHRETDPGDPKSRHKGKLDTEALLGATPGLNWTSVRPVYIYGPLNYNPVEEWFFHRLAAGRPVPVPGSGLDATQLGHVADLARAFVAILGNPRARGEIYNISGDKYVTFDGLARACAAAMGAPAPEIVHYSPKAFDFGKSKAFPFREGHFFADISKAKAHLGWAPAFDLAAGLKDSYSKDFGRGTFREKADFTADDMVLAAAGKQAAAPVAR